MARRPNTDRNGNSFSALTVGQVWEKGRNVPNYDPAVWRYDLCGKPIKRSEYGNTSLDTGWEIDHILPVAKGGGDELTGRTIGARGTPTLGHAERSGLRASVGLPSLTPGG